jgi:hypothetical protein
LKFWKHSLFLPVAALVVCLAHADDGPAVNPNVVPQAIVRGKSIVPTGGDIFLNAGDSVAVKGSPIRWQIVTPAKLPEGVYPLTFDSSGRSNVVLLLTAPPDGNYSIAATVYGSPDASGYPMASTRVFAVQVGLIRDPLPPPNPVPVPGPNPAPAPVNPPAPSPQDLPKPAPFTPTPVNIKLWAVYVYKIPDPAHTAAIDAMVADVVANPTIKADLAELGVDWRAWDSERPEMARNGAFDRYVDKGHLPILLVYDGRGNVYDENGAAKPAKLQDAFPAPATVASIVKYFKHLRGQ